VRREKEEEKQQLEREIKEAERLAGLLDINDSQHRAYLEEQHRKRLDSQSSSGSTKSSQSLSASQQAQLQQGSLGSYVQMAKTGYQELVNAIIR